MTEERIGDYRVHPAAQLFPRIESTDWEALKSSIEHHGQQQPIIVQGDVLLDGRNRLYACRALGIAPRIEEYNGPLTPLQLIETLNLHRRDLTEDQRASIQAAILVMHQAEHAAAAQKAGGEQHGKGRSKANTKSYEPNDTPKTREQNARSTVGQIAAKAKVSHHKAAQALSVEKAAPELAKEVRNGHMTLRVAEKQLQPQKPPQPTKRAGPPPKEHFDVEQAYQTIQTMIEDCPEKHRAKLVARLHSATGPAVWRWLKPGEVLIENNQTAFIAIPGQKEASNQKWPFGAGELIMEAVECLISDLSIPQRVQLRAKKW